MNSSKKVVPKSKCDVAVCAYCGGQVVWKYDGFDELVTFENSKCPMHCLSAVYAIKIHQYGVPIDFKRVKRRKNE